MPTFSTTVRFGSALVLAAATLLATGCRSTSVNTRRNVDPNPDASPSAPVFRSYERSGRPYDYDREPIPPVPPAEVPPVPGYTDPIPAPPDTEIPPSPSTQRKRRPWFPSAKKPKRLDSDDTSADNSPTRNYETGSVDQIRSERRSSVSGKRFPELNGLPVPIQSPNDASAIPLWAPNATDDSALNSGSSSASDDVQAISGVPVRRGTISPWPQSKRDSTSSRGVKPNLLPTNP